MRERCVSVVILLCLLIVSVPHESKSYNSGTANFVIAQTPHAPIAITSEADFISLGLLGEGLPSNPYIIEDFTIESVAGESCISISGNISSSYVIRDCVISGTDIDEISKAGIYLGAGQGRIEGCTFSDCVIGVGLEEINDVHIQDCIFNDDSSRGIKACNSSIVSIERCELSTDLSLRMDNVSNVLVRDCIIENDVVFQGERSVDIERCSVEGSTVYLGDVSEGTIRHNSLTQSHILLAGGTDSIDVYNNTLLRVHSEGISVCANNSVIYDNAIEGYGNQNYFGLVLGGYDCEVFGNEIRNFYYGLVVHYTGNDIHNNTIHDCSVCGVVMVSYSSDNRFYYNHVYNNNLNAHDDGTNNIWDDGIGIGNRWDDAWSAPYQINGSANAVDRYPIIIKGFDMVLAVVLTGVAIAVVVIFLGLKKRRT